MNLTERRIGLLLLVFFQGKAQTPADRPNSLWIVSEDNNTSLIGCHGNPYATTRESINR